MRASTLVLLPDQFSDPIRIIRVDEGGTRDERYASLTDIRTGEDGTDHPSIRRYETSDNPTAHLTDLVNSRVVITDPETIPATDRVELPRWARRNTALHPDRHDLASWLEAANRDPSAPWVSHLALTVRDALRDQAEHHPAIIAFPDRAFLAASDDNTHPAIQAVIDTFTTPAHEINEQGHRGNKSLAPMPLAKVNDDDHRTAIITRAQAVISEALVNAIEAKPSPTADDIYARWTEIVGADHAQRLRMSSDGKYSAPVAILDDHNNARYTATFVLATLKITLSNDKNDIWFDYHHAYDIDASRPFDINIAKTSLLRQGNRTGDQDDLLAALQEQAVPILELSTTPSGQFENRDLISSIPDSSPLLRDHPGFTFPDAILAYLMFREPGTFAAWWKKLMRLGQDEPAQGGEEIESEGAETDKTVADDTKPSEKDDGAETDGAGSDTDEALETTNGSEDNNLDTVSGFLAALSDTDQATVRRIRKEVARLRRTGATKVVEDDKFRADLDQRPEFYEKVWKRLTGLFKTAKAKNDADVQLCLFTDALWLRHLFLLNLYDKLDALRATSPTAATKDEARATAVLTLKQAGVAKVEIPAPPASGTSNDMGGGSA